MADNNRLSKGWERTTLGEVVTFQYGRGLREDRRDKSGNVPVYGSNGIVGYHSKAIVNESCVVVGRKGTAGAVHFANGPSWPIDTTYYVIPPEGINLVFLFYVLSSLQLGALDKSTAVPGLNRNDAYSIEIGIPPLPEQKRIVAKIEELLTKLDAGVAELQKAKAQLKSYRQAVLKAAVEGELTREWREAHEGELEPASVLLERILEDRRARWEVEGGKGKYRDPLSPNTNDLREVPDGWMWATVEQVAERIVDCLHSTPIFQRSGYYCVDTNWIIPGRLIYEKARYVNNGTFLERNRRMTPKNGDVMFSREGALLGIAVRVPEKIDICLGQRMMVFRLSNSINPHYFEIVLNSPLFRIQYLTEITGTASPHLNIRDIRLLGIPLPPIIEQLKLINKVERRLSIADEIERQIDQSLARAGRLRQSILKRAFEGKLVPQDPEDEPAEDLLERIRVAKEVQKNIYL